MVWGTAVTAGEEDDVQKHAVERRELSAALEQLCLVVWLSDVCELLVLKQSSWERLYA